MLLFPVVCLLLHLPASAQTEKKVYHIEVAGIRVGKMTATRTHGPDKTTQYRLISDVKVNFILFLLKIYYEVNTRQTEDHLVSARVDARTNRGNFYTLTTRSADGYHVESRQHKSEINKVITEKIEHTVINLFFQEPAAIDKAYAEYYGDFFHLKKVSEGKYIARMGDHQDTYFYQGGQLVKIIKKNPVKDFVMILEKP